MSKMIYLEPSPITEKENYSRLRITLRKERRYGLDKIEWYSPAIYFLHLKGEIVYIGKSINVRGRVMQHLITSHHIKFDMVSYKPYGYDKLDSKEKKFILKYLPKHNKKLFRVIYQNLKQEVSNG